MEGILKPVLEALTPYSCTVFVKSLPHPGTPEPQKLPLRLAIKSGWAGLKISRK